MNNSMEIRKLLNGEEKWRAMERMKARRGGQIMRPCIVMDRELNFELSLSDRLVGPCD